MTLYLLLVNTDAINIIITYSYALSKSPLEIVFHEQTPLEFVFPEQSYSSLHSGRSLAWDHIRGDIVDPCGVIADLRGIVAIPEAFGTIR